MSGFSPLSLSRREGRESALATLYESDMTGDDIDTVLERHFADPDDYGTDVARGVAGTLADIDAVIDRFAEDWSVARMASVDRAILRIGTWEVLYRPEVPTTAIVSEAVALANQYSTERSAPFINGLLVALADDARGRDA